MRSFTGERFSGACATGSTLTLSPPGPISPGSPCFPGWPWRMKEQLTVLRLKFRFNYYQFLVLNVNLPVPLSFLGVRYFQPSLFHPKDKWHMMHERTGSRSIWRKRKHSIIYLWEKKMVSVIMKGGHNIEFFCSCDKYRLFSRIQRRNECISLKA